jgi:hypothetical protein
MKYGFQIQKPTNLTATGLQIQKASPFNMIVASATLLKEQSKRNLCR